ncbi:hypothetical protein [Mesorhizobium sp. 1B3]|uniref:hypothetical protein n=1 Tax=Mesorhizobium sp. 1B3 TaxID=3243599 RepID=UPI003D95C4CC
MTRTPVRAATEGLPSIDRRKALSAAGIGLATILTGCKPPLAPAVAFAETEEQSPVMQLFQQWQATYHSADDTPDEVCDALMGVCSELEERMMALPSISAADLAAKLVVTTSYGDFEFDSESDLYAEILALCGGWR